MINMIMVEGIEGCGKTTLAKNLQNLYLKNGETLDYIKSPITESLTKFIRDILAKENLSDSDKELLALAFAEDKLYALSENGEIGKPRDSDIILDRFILSNYVYNYNDLPSKVSEYLMHAIQSKTNLLNMRKIYIFVDTPVNIAMERISNRNEKKESFDSELYQHKHYERFKVIEEEITKEYEEIVQQQFMINGRKSITTAPVWVMPYNEKKFDAIQYSFKSIYMHVDGTLDENEMASRVYDMITRIDNYIL